MSTGIQEESRLEVLQERMEELSDKCHYASALRVAQEIRRVAREDGDLDAYIRANFTIMVEASGILEPTWAREAAIEMIGLLENEDQARTIEPDLEDEEYARLVNWYSSCAYDNLGHATAEISGYNSDGVHSVVAEGIEICRQTGKTQCISCFRAYATDVHIAADDMDMASHYARMQLQINGRKDRRMGAVRDEICIRLYHGQLAAAAEKVDQYLGLIDSYHSPNAARVSAKPFITTIATLLGEPERWQQECVVEQPPKDEDLNNALQVDSAQAVIEFAAGDYDAAIKRLTPWDQKLAKQKCTNMWLFLRTRLLALHKKAGNEVQFEKLAQQLEKKAKEARDWHILRCLKHLRDPDCIPVPFPTFANMDCGPFAVTTETGVSKGESVSSDHPISEDADDPQAAETQAEIPESVRSILEQLKQATSFDEEKQAFSLHGDSVRLVLDQILATEPEVAAEANTTCWLLNTVNNLYFDSDRAAEFWSWAQRMIMPVREDAAALSLLAKFGCLLRYGHEQLQEELDDLTLEKMFLESLDMDPEQAGNFERAGDFYAYQNNIGEAERCYARSFRLDRTRESVASRLAGIYRRTDRERDALAVLDMAIRNGGQDPDLFWDAALTAHSLESHEDVVTYLGAYENAAPNQRWTNHYRASSLIALERFTEAREAALREQELNADCAFPQLVHLAAAAAGLGDTDEFRASVKKLLEVQLADVEYLSPKGLLNQFRTLCAAAASVLENEDELNRQIEDLMLATNMAPEELFERYRNDQQAIEGINFYHCTFEQPLDENWKQWLGRLPNEEELTSFQTTWGVLAETEEEAIQIAARWQARCYPRDAKLASVELADEGYCAGAGVVWQGWRQS